MMKKNKRKRLFRCYKFCLRPFLHRPKFVYLDEEIKDEPWIILSNHEGASAPMKWEMYFDERFRFWGTYEMTMGLRSTYKYLSTTYFHQKKHFPKFLAVLIGFIGCPFVNAFYKGMKLIPTYHDYRFITTLKESEKVINEGYNLIIYPEDSTTGYHKVLTSFSPGFVVLAKVMLKKGIDLNIYPAYLQKSKNTFVIDKPIKFSSILKELNEDKEKIAEYFLNKVNALGELDVNEIK